jgi:hypothetical protein
MSKTLYSKDYEILGEVWARKDELSKVEGWGSWINYYSLALCVSYAMSNKLVSINNSNENAKELIRMAWLDFCVSFSKDWDGKYKNLEDFLTSDDIDLDSVDVIG